MATAALSSFVGNVKLRLLVDNATSTNDDPTPIYVLDELVQALAAGDTRAGVDAVCARLAHRSPVVKQKALKVVTHIGRKGSPDLRRLMARQSAAVRSLLHFRCEPDPFKGDTVWKRVQEYAQEALNAIHGEPDAPSAMAPSQRSLGGRIQGFGSESGSGGGSGMLGFGSESSGGGGGSSGGRMVGFGSADVVSSGIQAISSGMRSLGSGLGRQQGLLRQDGYSAGQLDDGSSMSSGRSRGLMPPGSSSFSQPIIQAGTPALAAASSSAGVSSSAGAAAPLVAAGSGAGGHTAEQRLVDRICTPAGLRAAPGRDDTRAFVDGLFSLDGPVVAQMLQRKLETGPWQATLRALCAIEAVVETGSSSACGQVAVHFQANPEPVRRAANSPQASVRQRAQKVLSMLGDSSAADAGASASANGGSSSQQEQLYTEDLLGEAEPAAAGNSSSSAAPVGGLADLLGDAVEPSSGAAPAASSSTGAADLLAGLDLGAGAGPAHAAPRPAAMQAQQQAGGTADLFAEMLLGEGQQQQSAPLSAAPQQPADPLDLLGGLSLQPAATSPAPAPAIQQPATSTTAGGILDLLGGSSMPAAAAAPAPLTSIASSSNGYGSRGGGPLDLHPMQQQHQMYGGMPAALGGPGPASHGPPLGAGLSMAGGMAPQFAGNHHPPGMQHNHTAAAQHHHGGADLGMQPAWHPASYSGTLAAGPGGGLPPGQHKESAFNFVDDAIQSLRKK